MTFIDYLKSFWWLFINAGYLLLILTCSFLAFTIPDQSSDFIYVFLQDFEITYIISVYASLAFWCFMTWYSACIVLQIDPVQSSLNRKNNQSHVNLSVLVPKILGIVPCLVMICAFSSLDTPSESTYLTVHNLSTLTLSVLMWFIFEFIDRKSDIQNNIAVKSSNRNTQTDVSYRIPSGFRAYLKYLWKIKPIGNWPSLREVDIFKERTNHDPSIRQEVVFICQFTGVKFFYKWLGGFCLVLTIALCFPAINLLFSAMMRPGAVLIAAFASYTLLFTIVAYFHDYSRRPFGYIIVIMIIAFSFRNDNTGLKYIRNNKVSKLQPIDSVFSNWLKIKKGKWFAKYSGRDSADMPIVFIATQGGGIRGLTWTTRILHHFDKTYPGFIDQTFLISGVSGGGVGATAFLSWRVDQETANDSFHRPTYDEFDSFTKRDFLSPVTTSFAFGDNLQRFLPAAVPSLDRSKMLGYTWDTYYNECMKRESFSRSFLEMWYRDGQFDYNIPSLILNGTLAENGQRVLTSNLRLGSSDWFKDDIEFFNATKKDVSRSTAALNCSRFPFLTSGALMPECGASRGHIVDGGYRENTGLQTLLNVFCTIRKQIQKEQRIKILVIYLQNGRDEMSDKPVATRLLQDWLVPIQAIVSVNGTSVPAKSVVQATVQLLDESTNANIKFRTIKLDEDREESAVALPLGWYMSEIVSQQIDKRVNELKQNDPSTIAILETWFKSK
jgi:hypothetical protein